MTDTVNEAPKSFREVKAQELRDEQLQKAEATSSEPELEQPTGNDDGEDVVDGLDSASEMELETPTEDEELDEPTESDGADDGEAESVDYQSKYEELEKEYRRVTANRQQIETDRASEAEVFVTMKHELGDSLDKARQGAEFYTNIANQQLQQLQQVNPATLQPEQQSQYYQQLNMATQNAQQQQHALENYRKYESEQNEVVKRREAEISSARLKASIPEWSNEHYSELGKVAIASGFSAEEYSEITDYRVIQLLHKQWAANKASEAVKQTVKQRKSTPPKSRNAKQQVRNERGQFEKAKKDFQPNKRGSFAAMKAAQMRTGR